MIAGSPQRMAHHISHQFNRTVKIKSVLCDLCGRSLFIGLKCQYCTYYCHQECHKLVPKSCGLPPEFVQLYKQTLSGENGNIQQNIQSVIGIGSLKHIKHKSNSRFYLNLIDNYDDDENITKVDTFTSIRRQSQSQPCLLFDENSQSAHSDSSCFKKESSKNVTIQPQHSASVVDNGDEIDEKPHTIDEGHDVFYKKNDAIVVCDQQQHMSRKIDIDKRSSILDLDINFDELSIGEQIRCSRFNAIHRGYWHGMVNIKMFNVLSHDNNNNDDEKDQALKLFLQEVSICRKTRHQNLILFMGACMQPPQYAIVTAFSPGLTLCTHIHTRRDKFSLSRIFIVIEQICLGMSYLHSRGILHKDLSTNNIIYENGKVIITEFGISSITKLYRSKSNPNLLIIPTGWLCYMAPEIIHNFNVLSWKEDNLPYSRYSDIYAFGTILYELFSSSWPFKGFSPESIIWHIGRGIKQPIQNVKVCKKLMNLLTMCWAFKYYHRPSFNTIYWELKSMPRTYRPTTHLGHSSKKS